MPDDTYHQIHFAWAEPTLLGRVGPGPAATSLTEEDQPALRSWRDRLLPALTADYRSALPGTDPADYPETLWARAYPDGRAALVYRWPGEVRDAHAWAIVGPARGLTFPRVLSLHENPHTRPSPTRPPGPGWAAVDALSAPDPWERTAAPGAVRTRDRRAAETAVAGEPVLVGAVAAALARPDLPIHVGLDPERADLWQAVQLRFLWGVHRILRDVLTPPRAIPAAGWRWSFSTYDPVLGTPDGQHLAFGPPMADTRTTFLHPPAPDHLAVAESLVALLRDEGGDVLADHLRERGVPEAPTFADRRALLCDWLDPRARVLHAGPGEAPVPAVEEAPGHDAPRAAVRPGPADGFGATVGPPGESATVDDVPTATDLPDLDDVPEPEWLPPEYEPPADLDTVEPPEPPEPPEPANPPDSADLPEPTELPGLDAPAEPDDLTQPGGFLEPTAPPSPDTPPAPDDLIEPGCLTGPEAPAEPDDLPDLPEVEAPETEDSDQPQPPPLWPLAEREPRPEPEPHESSAPPPATPDPRSPEDAPPLDLAPEPDYSTETALVPDEIGGDESPDDNWPTHYADIPLARLERWHSRRGPEGARRDVLDARAAIRAERAELQRVLDERDRYHTEVQDLRREVARLDRPWLDTQEEPSAPTEPPARRRAWAVVLLVAVVLLLGLEAGARSGTGVTDLLALVWGALPFG